MFDWLKKRAPATGPDFSKVDSAAKAAALAERGELVPLQLLPAMFGGEAIAVNIVYVPEFVVDIKRGIDENTVAPLGQDGKITRYAASPKYQGRSVVPISIQVRAHDPADFQAEIRIWGDALQQDSPNAA